jgi:glycosyltransferase involved in cell wall biosynthesis
LTSKPEAIVLLMPGFASGESDSTCLPQQQDLVKALKKNNPGQAIILFAFQYPFRNDNYTWHDVQVFSFNGKDKGGVQRLITWLKVWKRLKKIHREYTIRGILSFWCGECALLGNYFAKKKNLRHYCWILGQDTRASNKYVKRINPRAGELIALSDFLRDTFQKNHGILPQHVIPPGIDSTQFSTTVFTREIDILGAGSLISLKQFDVFISLVAVLKNSFPNIKAAICGKGPEEISLRKLVLSAGLEKQVEFTGEIPRRELMSLMQRSKLLLHPSSYEGFSGVCHEAVFAGCHVVGFHKPMNQEIPHWHVVNSVDEMRQSLFTLLDSDLDHSPVLYNSIDETAKKVMRLFKEEV